MKKRNLRIQKKAFTPNLEAGSSLKEEQDYMTAGLNLTSSLSNLLLKNMRIHAITYTHFKTAHHFTVEKLN